MKKSSMPQCLYGLLIAGLMASTTTQAAALSDWLPAAKLDTKTLKTVYVGAGLTNELAHVNAEFPTAYGTGYVKAGSYLNGANEAAGLVGFRYPYMLTGTDKNGYYVGGFIGHIDSLTLDGEDYNRLGFGGELAYVWMNNQRISTASIGVGAGERKQGRFGSKEHSTPMLMFGYSFSFGVY